MSNESTENEARIGGSGLNAGLGFALHDLPPEGSTLRELGKRLAELPDEDQWADSEQMLFKIYDEAQAENQHLRGLLLWALYHHQGACSGVGQPIRKALGIGEYAPLTEEEIVIAKMAAERA